MITNNNLGIYIHIPYCVKKCRYCDFLSYTTHNLQGRAYYTVKLAEEILGKSKVYGKEYTVDSIFIGGGTPSLLETRYLEEIFDVLHTKFNTTEDAEITIEANPGTLSSKKLKDYKDLGINRISMGVQSLDSDVLGYLGRIHSAQDAVNNYQEARKAGFDNINIDMMFGIPGQSFEVWRRDLKKIIDLNPDHVSFYSLQVEDKTPIFYDIVSGKVDEIPAETDRLMYHDAINTLTDSGYNHYEISNAAVSGKESRHNLKYWSMQDYIGIGLGAHSFVDNKRFSNTEILKDYLATDGKKDTLVIEHESSRADNMAEYVFLGLRKTEGISLSEFEKKYGKKFLDLYKYETEDLVNRGLIEIKDGRLRLTRLGLDLSNHVFMEYV